MSSDENDAKDVTTDLARPTGLLLNPRLPNDQRQQIESAWNLMRDEISAAAGIDAIGILTSGSTGGTAFGTIGGSVVATVTVLSQTALAESARAVNRHFHFTQSTRWALMLPTFHVGGYLVLVRAALCGAHVSMFNGEWNPLSALKFMTDEKITVVSLVPAQVFDLVSQQIQAPGSLQTVIVGGGRLDPGLRERAIALGWPVFESYGMTETASQIAASENAQSARMKSLGHFQLKIDPDTKQLLVKGPALFSGKIEIANDGVRWLPVNVDEDGFFRTSDRVQLFHENGNAYLSFLGRTVDVVKVLGENVDLAKVRMALAAIDFPRGATAMDVVAIGNQRREHELILLLEGPQSVFDPEQSQLILRKVQAGLRESLLPIEVPTAIKILAKFPRSELGKVLYPKLLAELS